MPSAVEFNSKLGIVEIRYTGRVTAEEFKKTTILGFELAKTNDTNLFLIDDSELESAGALVGLYDLPKLYEELGLERLSKGAVVMPAASSRVAEAAQFHETVCRNRGWQVKVFTDRQEAIDWLMVT